MENDIAPCLLVLAGGFGTRLRSEVAKYPKPLAPINDVPFLSLLLDKWVEFGIKKFVFLLHYEAEQIVSFLKSRDAAGLFVDSTWTTIVEQQPLGTGGAIANVVHELVLPENFLVANADTWLSDSMFTMLSSDSPAMGVINVENTQRYGSVQIDQAGNIVGFVEKNNTQGEGWINAGLYNLKAALFATWDGRPFSLENDFFPELLDNQCFQAVFLEEEFIDIGIPEDYRRFSHWIKSGKSYPL